MASSLFEQGLQQFEEAAAELSWAGSQPPDDYKFLQQRYQRKKQALLDYVTSLEESEALLKAKTR